MFSAYAEVTGSTSIDMPAVIRKKEGCKRGIKSLHS
jgi:hypothetical protein